MFTTALSPSTPTWPRGAVFDCDGLLVDSAACWNAAYANVLNEVGIPSRPIHRPSLDGASVSAAAEVLSAESGRRIDASTLRARLLERTRDGDVAPMPGAVALVSRLVGQLPLAVASNGPEAVVRTALERCGLVDAFDVIVSAEHCRAHKPAPDVYLQACASLGVHPSDAIAFEDSAVGARAAALAGLFVVGVGRSVGDEVDLRVGRIDDPRVVSLIGARSAPRVEGRRNPGVRD